MITATYRLQLNPDFGFADVEALLPYFRRLGISHLYLSPIMEARRGSTHGYDVIDHNTIRAELGGRPGFDRLLDAVRREGLRLILDFVPNHAGVGPYNASWQDVLAYGPHSPFARFFDIDWNPIKPELRNKILLPFLGQPYGRALDDGEISLSYEDGRLYATYYESRFALNPSTYAAVLEEALPQFERTPLYWDLKDLLEAYRSVGSGERSKWEALRPRLVSLADRIDLTSLAGGLRGPVLHEILERQFWRLAYWKTAGYEINYRRFFDINALVALRMEDPHVFWDTHRTLGELLAQEGVDGVRIDHIDGLFDPHGYLDRLRDLGARHIWVEKILAAGEVLPEAWPAAGSTGYEFLNDAMGVLLHPDGALPLDRTYRRSVPEARSFADEVYRSKILVMETMLSSELFRLAYELDRISEADYHTRDFTLESLREALAEVITQVDRYRTYLPFETEAARHVVLEAVYRARQRNPATEPTVYDFIARVILEPVRSELQPSQQAWTGRFQQYTAPMAAKAVEDTAFYRYLRLTALNEVGGEPDTFGQSVQAFHAHARFRAQRYPLNLLTTASHDHKRGEDTRMRLIALAETPRRWVQALRSLDEIAEKHRSGHGPSRPDEYLFYQTLVALWDGADTGTLLERLQAYMQKASRESKRQTSWLNPNEAYETALDAFIEAVVTDDRTDAAIGDLSRSLAEYGFFNGISQLILKLTTPGVPDTYQGCELLDLSLVDPDNRRPVDYARRVALLDELEPPLAEPEPAPLRAMTASRDVRAKLYVTARLLRLRRDLPDLFVSGDYHALDVSGSGAAHWLAFTRTHGHTSLLVVVSRFPATLGTTDAARVDLPEAIRSIAWRDVLTGETPPSEDDRILLSARPWPWYVLVGEHPAPVEPATEPAADQSESSSYQA